MKGHYLLAAALLMTGCTITVVPPQPPVEPLVDRPDNPPTQPPIVVVPQPPVPTALPSRPPVLPTPSPTWSQFPYPSAYPSTTPSNGAGAFIASVRGMVMDENGARVQMGKVRLRSLNPSAPFDATVEVTGGVYVINSVPAGVQVEIAASRDGWTTRTLVKSLVPGFANEVDFDTENGYFISDRPEIERVEPAAGAENVGTSKVVVKLTLSEPLDSVNQRRFEDAIRIYPANGLADPQNPAATDLNTLTRLNADENGRSTRYSWSFAEGSTGERADDVATVTWDAEGRSATFTFSQPYPRVPGGAPAYQVALVGASGEIKDTAGNLLGSAELDQLTDSHVLGQLIYHAFRIQDLDGTGGIGWTATHAHVSVFKGTP